MNKNNQGLLEANSYEQFEYRLVYLRPSPQADERLTVGIVAASTDGFELRLLSSPVALDLMMHVFGEAGVEQFQFAAGELRRVVSRIDDWASLEMPTDLLETGDVVSAFTRDRTGFLSSVLASTSSFMRGGSLRAREVVATSATKVSRDLYHEVSLLDPLKANNLFHRKVTLENGGEVEEVDLPILGNKIFGAPVSLARATSDQKMRAEAYVAKFRWIQRFLTQQPKIYILVPCAATVKIASKADSSIRELRAVAAASNVELGVSESMAELAAIVVNDEAA